MRSELWEQVDSLLERALELPVAERGAFLARSCGAQTQLHREVAALLEAEPDVGAFLERPLLSLELMETEAADEADLELGKHLGPYRLLRTLGSGGMGTVYLAERDDGQYRRQVALKLSRNHVDPELLERFLVERQILAELEHPGIARLYDGGTTADGRPYLAMEVIDGRPVDAYCDRHNLAVDARLGLFRQVCDAVQYAHNNLVVHRDLKPSNILVTAGAKVKLLDFGLGKWLEGGRFDVAAAETRSHLRPMTLAYASPEQVRGETITTACDTYALGVLLYRLLTGQSPYRLELNTAHELERAILEQEPERPSDVVDGLGEDKRKLRRKLIGDLDTIVMKALRKRPHRRYGSPRELADDLGRYLGHLPVLARPDSPVYRLGKFVRRNRLALAAAAMGAAVLVGFSVMTHLHSKRVTRERDIARYERTKAQQVSDLLLDLFESSDPGASRGDDLTVREVLDRAARNVDRLQDQPELQATYMATMADVYANLGRLDEAAPLLEEALRLRRQEHGAQHVEVAESLRSLAGLHFARGDYERSQRLTHDALAMRRRLLGNDHPDVAESLKDLGLLLYEQDRLEDAEPLFRESLDIGRRLGDNGRSTTKDALNGLALLHQNRGEYEAAEPLFREALSLARTLYGADHPGVFVAINNLATLLHDRRRHEAAEALYREALEMARKLYGEQHPDMAVVIGNLAQLAYERGDLDEAERTNRQSVAMVRKLFGDDHPAVAAHVTALGRLLVAMGESAEAEPMLRQALRVYGHSLPEGHWRIASTQSALGACLTRQGRFEEAEALLVNSHPVLARQIGECEARTLGALDEIIEHYESRGLTEQAAQYRASHPADACRSQVLTGS